MQVGALLGSLFSLCRRRQQEVWSGGAQLRSASFSSLKERILSTFTEVRNLTGLIGSPGCLVLLLYFHLTGVLPTPAHSSITFAPVIFFLWSFLSVSISGLNVLQPDDLSGKVEVVAHTISSLVLKIVGSLLVVLFSKEWSSLLYLLVLVTNFTFLSCSVTCQKEVSSSLASVFVPVVTDTPAESRKSELLGRFTISNLCSFLLIISTFVAVIHLSPPDLDLNNPVSPHQMLQTFNWVLLPSCFLSLTCSFFLIRSSDKRPGTGGKLKMIVNLLIILAAILSPILSGKYLFSNRPESGFLLVTVRIWYDRVICLSGFDFYRFTTA